MSVDAQELAHDLEAALDGEVRFSNGDRALYATGGSNYRQLPIGVVIPRSVDDVVETVRLCRQYEAPVLSRGGGTSLAGQCCNVAVIIDFSKYMHSIVEIDPQRKLARVQPGLILDHLRKDSVAVLMPAPDVDLVLKIAADDRLLPEKATSFQPKPSVGVLIRSLRDE